MCWTGQTPWPLLVCFALPATGHWRALMCRRTVRRDHGEASTAARTVGRAEEWRAPGASRGHHAGIWSPTLLALIAVLALIAGLTSPCRALAEPVVPSANEAMSAAQADARVAAVLEGVDYEVDAVAWGADGAPSGTTLTYSWLATAARSASDVWPLLDTKGAEPPSFPLDPVEHRLRLSDLTRLRVDVLADGNRVLQVRPLMGETEFVVQEETWPPFSLVPRFTERPWVLAPVYVVAAIWIVLSSWRRSRAWNRRLPSMTRHDRQFILRLSVVLFLLFGIGWQIYEGVVAAQGPSATPHGMNAGDLTALPILLLPPAVFFAALALEFSSGAHRVAWGLVAVLACAGSVYFLASALTGVAGNLNLSYYVLLGALALVSAPRAFAARRMGWSRKGLSRYA